MKTKMVRFSAVALLSFAAVIGGAMEAAALPPGGLLGQSVAPKRAPLRLAAVRETIAPFAFAAFCANQEDQCERRGGSATSIELTKAKRAELQRINMQVNQKIQYQDDPDDDWRAGVSVGDCDDYALTKRQVLLDAGWPSGVLRIATARTAEGIGHAVLVVSTNDGDLVLDNRTNVVKPWFATQLRWIKIQSPEDPRRWLKL